MPLLLITYTIHHLNVLYKELGHDVCLSILLRDLCGEWREAHKWHNKKKPLNLPAIFCCSMNTKIWPCNWSVQLQGSNQLNFWTAGVVKCQTSSSTDDLQVVTSHLLTDSKLNDAFLNIATLASLQIVPPVTTATVVHSFSAMKLVKTRQFKTWIYRSYVALSIQFHLSVNKFWLVSSKRSNAAPLRYVRNGWISMCNPSSCFIMRIIIAHFGLQILERENIPCNIIKIISPNSPSNKSSELKTMMKSP